MNETSFCMCLSSRFTRSDGSTSHCPDGTHLDHTVSRGGATGRPRKRGVQVGDVNQVVAPELFLGLRVWAIEHLGLAVGQAHGGCRRTRFQAVRSLEYARLV